MSAEPAKIAEMPHVETGRAVVRAAALAMYRTHGCERTWRALYEIADEIVSMHEREREK